MSKHILVTGPSGSGKTYISAMLRKQGIHAVDADLVKGLSGWFNGNGEEVNYPPDADKEFLDTHEFLWNKDFLRKFLKEQDEIYLFGMSGNVFDTIDLFDKVYFLQVSQERLASRLRNESRENPMGKTDYQLKNALDWANHMEEIARRLGIRIINANQTVKQIYSEIK